MLERHQLCHLWGHHQTATGGAVPLGSVPVTVTSIRSFFRSGVGAAGTFSGTQLSGASPPAWEGITAAACGGWRAGNFGAWLGSAQGVASRQPRAISISTCFAWHLASWVGCPPPQLGNFISVWGHTFPTLP